MPDEAKRPAAILQYEHARECEAFFASCGYPEEARRRRQRARIHYQEASDGLEP